MSTIFLVCTITFLSLATGLLSPPEANYTFLTTLKVNGNANIRILPDRVFFYKYQN
jgi:hypothetical protein